MGIPDDEIVAPEAVPDDLMCIICLETFVDPVFCAGRPCRHTFCRQCISDALQINTRAGQTCPTCRRQISHEQLVQNNFARDILGEVVVFCQNRADGCTWTGQLATRQQHRNCCLGEDLRNCRAQLARAREEVEELNVVIADRSAEIRDLEESSKSLKDTMRIAQADLERRLGEANAKRAKQDEVIATVTSRNASMEDQLRALEINRTMLEARNLEMESELACRKPENPSISRAVQCSPEDIPFVDGKAESPHEASKRNSTSGILEAARRGDLVQLQTILETCAPEEVNVTTKPEGMSALHLVAYAGHAKVVEMLLGNANFKSINSTTSAKQFYGSTALHLAAFAGHETVAVLLLHCDRFTSASAGALEEGGTALHAAAWQGHAAVADLLLKSHRFKDDAVNAASSTGATALHVAAFRNNLNVVTLLLQSARFFKVSASSKDFRATALHMAAEGGHVAVMMALLDSPKFSDAAVNKVGSGGFSALHIAVREGHHQAALLLKASSRFTALAARTLAGKTAIDLARQKKDENMMALLLS